MTRMDLAHLSPLTHPRAFIDACVLSPTDPAMDTSDAALGLLEAEKLRCSKRRMPARWLRVMCAMDNIRKLRKASRVRKS